MFGQERIMTIEHEILKENYDTLVKDHEILQERIKLSEETYEIIKLHLQNKAKELEERNLRLLEECARERVDKEKFKKMFEEMMKTMESERNCMADELAKKNQELLLEKRKEKKAVEKKKYKKMFEEMKKTMETERKAMVDELAKKNQELVLAKRKEQEKEKKYKKMFEEMKKTMEIERNYMVDELMKKKQELALSKRKEEETVEKFESKYAALAEKFDVVEVECAYLKSLYDVEVVASGGSASAVVSGIGETDHLIGQGENEVNHNLNNPITDTIMISDESDDDGEHDNPPRESKISSHLSAGRNEEEQCRDIANSSNENQGLGQNNITPTSVSHPQPFSPSSSSSSSSSSSAGYEVMVKLPPNWPEWAIPKGRGNGSNKS